MKSSIVRMLSALLVACTLFSAAGCAEGGAETEVVSASEAEASEAAKNTDAAEAPATDQVLAVGEAGRTEDLEISITNVQKATEWINSPPEGSEYVVVALKITNISDEEQSVGAGDFQFVNASGSREAYTRSTGVKTDPDTFGGTDIAPGESFEGSIVFAIPVEMSNIELHYLESYQTALRFAFTK